MRHWRRNDANSKFSTKRPLCCLWWSVVWYSRRECIHSSQGLSMAGILRTTTSSRRACRGGNLGPSRLLGYRRQINERLRYCRHMLKPGDCHTYWRYRRDRKGASDRGFKYYCERLFNERQRKINSGCKVCHFGNQSTDALMSCLSFVSAHFDAGGH